MGTNHRNLKTALLFIPNVLVFAATELVRIFGPPLKELPLKIFLVSLSSGMITIPIALMMPNYLFIPTLILGPMIIIIAVILFMSTVFISLDAYRSRTWWINEDGKIIRNS